MAPGDGPAIPLTALPGTPTLLPLPTRGPVTTAVPPSARPAPPQQPGPPANTVPPRRGLLPDLLPGVDLPGVGL